MFKLLLATTLLLIGCVSIFTETEDEVRFTYGPGGLLKDRLAFYSRLQEVCKIKKCIIDGQMVSADAFYAFGLPGVCYTRNAIWSPHAISNFGIVRMENETKFATLHLPKPMQEYFKASAYYWNWVTVPEIRYDELLTIWPEGVCDDADRAAALAE